MNYLVRLVLLLVGELEVLSTNLLDCLISVVRTFDLFLQLALQFLESFTFFNRHVKFLTF